MVLIENLLHLCPPELWGAFSSDVALEEQQKQPSHEARPCSGTWRTKTPLSVL